MEPWLGEGKRVKKNRDDESRYDGPPLSEPSLGMPFAARGYLAYRTRKSALNQAARWNEILEQDPVHGPVTGFAVGVAPIASQTEDGPRFELIWVRFPSD